MFYVAERRTTPGVADQYLESLTPFSREVVKIIIGNTSDSEDAHALARSIICRADTRPAGAFTHPPALR